MGEKSSLSQCKGMIEQMLNNLGTRIIYVAEERMVARLQTPGATARQPRAWVGTSEWMGLVVGTQQMEDAVSSQR